MTLEEKIKCIEEQIKFIKKINKKERLSISGCTIKHDQFKFIHSYKDLKSYESMDDNTIKFAEQVIFDLIFEARRDNRVAHRHFDFYVILFGNFDDLEQGTLYSAIIRNKEKIVLRYDNLYLRFSKLLEEFEKYNVKFEMDFANSGVNDMRFLVSYSPKKAIKNEKEHQLKKVKKS